MEVTLVKRKIATAMASSHCYHGPAKMVPLVLHDGLHPLQYGFVPRRQIYDNIANAMTAIEYAKYIEQDVLILQVDIAKAFDTVQWDFIAQLRSKWGLDQNWCKLSIGSIKIHQFNTSWLIIYVGLGHWAGQSSKVVPLVHFFMPLPLTLCFSI